MLQNGCILAKLGFNTAENEPRQVRCRIGAREPCFGSVSVRGITRVPEHDVVQFSEWEWDETDSWPSEDPSEDAVPGLQISGSKFQSSNSIPESSNL